MSVVIESGTTVEITYTLKDEAGDVLDSNEGQAPLRYVHGRREIVPGLERALDGLRAGDERQVTVAAADAYGPVDPAAVAEVPRQTVPAEALVPGTPLVARRQDGATRPVRVKEVRESTVVLDLNHPLAGKTLHFDVRIVDVAPAA